MAREVKPILIRFWILRFRDFQPTLFAHKSRRYKLLKFRVCEAWMFRETAHKVSVLGQCLTLDFGFDLLIRATGMDWALLVDFSDIKACLLFYYCLDNGLYLLAFVVLVCSCTRLGQVLDIPCPGQYRESDLLDHIGGMHGPRGYLMKLIGASVGSRQSLLEHLGFVHGISMSLQVEEKEIETGLKSISGWTCTCGQCEIFFPSMLSIYLTIVIQEQGPMDCSKQGYVSIWCMWVQAHCKEVCVWKDRQRHRLLAVGVWALSHQDSEQDHQTG